MRRISVSLAKHSKLSLSSNISIPLVQSQSNEWFHKNISILFAMGAAAMVGAGWTQHEINCKASIYELSEVDSMTEQSKRFPRSDTYKFTKKLVEHDDEDPAALWRHARAAYQYAEEKDTPKQLKKELYAEALRCAKESVHLDGSDHNSRRWLGTSLQANSAFEGYKQQIADAYEVKSQWEQAVELNPDDATAHHLLGRWALTVAEMPWYQRAFAKTLFAEPPSSSYQEARDYFAGAERISPSFWKANLYYLAYCENCLKNVDEAISLLCNAIRLPVKSKDDEDVQKKALELLRKIDKQQDHYKSMVSHEEQRKRQEILLQENQQDDDASH